jgi:hypothetical protein
MKKYAQSTWVTWLFGLVFHLFRFRFLNIDSIRSFNLAHYLVCHHEGYDHCLVSWISQQKFSQSIRYELTLGSLFLILTIFPCDEIFFYILIFHNDGLSFNTSNWVQIDSDNHCYDFVTSKSSFYENVIYWLGTWLHHSEGEKLLIEVRLPRSPKVVSPRWPECERIKNIHWQPYKIFLAFSCWVWRLVEQWEFLGEQVLTFHWL